MRTIKFRGLRLDGKGWVYGYLFKDEGEFYIQDYHSDFQHDCTVCEVIPESIGQFTGLTDKNGVEIFEGDKVKNEDCGYIEIIEFEICDRTQGFCINTDDTNTVIGNIHEK